MSRRVAHTTAAVPVLGSALLLVLAVTEVRVFDLIVREDSVLEWAEVCSYGIVAIVGALVAQRTHGFVRVAYALLALAAVLAIGEELSWGQRLFHVGTPQGLAAANSQRELNVHDVGPAGSMTRLVLLIAAAYGATLPLFRRPGPFVPPRVLVPAFAVVAGYFAIRFTLLPHPTYVQAKFSEWPELCFAAAVALMALSTLRSTAAEPASSETLTRPLVSPLSANTLRR